MNNNIESLMQYLNSVDDELHILNDILQKIKEDETKKNESRIYNFKSELVTIIGDILYFEEIIPEFMKYPGVINDDEVIEIKEMQHEFERYKSILLSLIADISHMFVCTCRLNSEVLAEYKSGNDFLEFNQDIKWFINDAYNLFLNIVMRQKNVSELDYSILSRYYHSSEKIEEASTNLLKELVLINECIRHVDNLRKKGKLQESVYDSLIKQLEERTEELQERINKFNEMYLKMHQCEQVNSMEMQQMVSKIMSRSAQGTADKQGC